MNLSRLLLLLLIRGKSCLRMNGYYIEGLTTKKHQPEGAAKKGKLLEEQQQHEHQRQQQKNRIFPSFFRVVLYIQMSFWRCLQVET